MHKNLRLHTTPPRGEGYRYLPVLSMLFVAFYLIANVLGSKPVLLGPIIIPAGLMIFPLTYVVGLMLTEVYGFAASRKVIWTALLCNLLMALCCYASIALPASAHWKDQQAYETILGLSSRIMVVSVLTYFVGEFINAYVVAKLKVKFSGRFFVARGVLGNWMGECVETSLFIPLAFYGRVPTESILKMTFFYFLFKFSYAFVAVLLVSPLVQWIKMKEHLDVYDAHTHFNPFARS